MFLYLYVVYCTNVRLAYNRFEGFSNFMYMVVTKRDLNNFCVFITLKKCKL